MFSMQQGKQVIHSVKVTQNLCREQIWRQSAHPSLCSVLCLIVLEYF